MGDVKVIALREGACRSVQKRPAAFSRDVRAGHDAMDAKTSSPMLKLRVQGEGKESARGANRLCRARYAIHQRSRSG